MFATIKYKNLISISLITFKLQKINWNQLAALKKPSYYILGGDGNIIRYQNGVYFIKDRDSNNSEKRDVNKLFEINIILFLQIVIIPICYGP